MKIEVKNTSGKSVGSIDLDDSVFGADNIHEHLLWEAVKWQLAKRRAGTASTKRFGEVRGSSKKIWKQKGTGQARHGARKANLFVGGGSSKGPKPRSYEYQLPRQVKKAALRAALALRASEHKIVVLDHFGTDGKTKSVATALATLGSNKALIVDAKTNDKLVRGAKNLATSQWLAPEGLNVYDILRHDTLIVTQDAIKSITSSLGEVAHA
ncbi:MAG TPA: 50S ribosomal protein L4 [Kofleriaceae bacterium]|nr:50S ribosomal protein L4 [Kofleriaceae bacterium]